MKHLYSVRLQAGVMLIEVLIAILIFSIGILGITALQAVSIKQSTDARYRSDAAVLANQLIGAMWLSNRTPASLQSMFSTGGSGYNTWYTVVQNTLPRAASYPPTVVVDSQGNVTIQINWLDPNESSDAAPHFYIAVTQPTAGN